MKTKLTLTLLISLLLLPTLFHIPNLLQEKSIAIVAMYTLFSILLLLLPLVFIRPIFYAYLAVPFLILMPFELIHVINYDGYTTLAAFVSTIESNPSEALEFQHNYRHYLYILYPLVLLCLISIFFYFNKNYRLLSGIKITILILFITTLSTFTSKTVYDLYNRSEDVFGKGLQDLFFRLANQNYPYSHFIKTYKYIKQHNALLASQLTKKDFSFGAKTDEKTLQKNPVSVLIIGETSRASNWQLGGYHRKTNPELSKRDGLVYFNNTISAATHTSQTVQLVLNRATPTNLTPLYNEKSIITAFSEAGYKTIWLSNQNMTGGVETAIYSIASEADHKIFSGTDYNVKSKYDEILVPELQEILRDNESTPLFIVIHTMGSHEVYRQRYPKEFEIYKPTANGDDYNFSSPEMREKLLNSYDNSILYTDYVLNQLIDTVDKTNRLSTVVYFSDHGENLLDHDSKRFGHGGAVPTHYVTDIPMFIWASENFRFQEPDLYQNISNNQNHAASNLYLFDSLLGLSRIHIKEYSGMYNLADESFIPSDRFILNTSYKPLKYTDILRPADKNTITED